MSPDETVPPDCSVDDDPYDGEVWRLLDAGRVSGAVEVILLEIGYEADDPECDGCGLVVGHTRWCPLRYWR